MNGGELLTTLSIWLALVAYTVGLGLKLEARGRQRAAARWVWTVGCGWFLIHVVCAFTFFHHWSHSAAYRETEQRTAELTGVHWGGGLYLNYLFAAAWLAEVLWWWVAPNAFARRSGWVTGLIHGFLFFMMFNGTVVFVHGPKRWLGLILCGSLASLWWRHGRGAKEQVANPQP